MPMRRSIRWVTCVASLSCTLTASGGAQRPAGLPCAPPTRTVDTLHGWLKSYLRSPVLLVRSGRLDVELVSQRAVLQQMAGLEVRVAGTWLTRAGPRRRFRVQDVTALAMAGVPVFDGTLSREPEADFLVTSRGARIRIGHLPAELRLAQGRRVLIFDSVEFPWSGRVIASPGDTIVAAPASYSRDTVTVIVPDSILRRRLTLELDREARADANRREPARPPARPRSRRP